VEGAVEVAEEDLEAEDVEAGDEEEDEEEEVEVAGVDKDEVTGEEEVGVVWETGTGVTGVTGSVVMAMKASQICRDQSDAMETHDQKRWKGRLEKPRPFPGRQTLSCPEQQGGGVRHCESACTESCDEQTFLVRSAKVIY
jgi:hypothetical protein